MPRAFIIMPFGVKTDLAGKVIDFKRVHDDLIVPALKASGLAGGTTGEIIEAGNIREDMFGLIIEADLVVCDITIHNANVFYELGIRHAMRKKHTILIKGQPVKDAPPFDILTDRYLEYAVDDPAQTLSQLIAMVRATLVSNRETDSPVYKLLPKLPEPDIAAAFIAVPYDLQEEIGRAKAAKSLGWLRLLADEVGGKRYQYQALQLIGQAQWDLKDLEGGTETFERIRNVHPENIAANLALANLFQLSSVSAKKPEFLADSDSALTRVLAQDLDPKVRAEASALRGRNKKTEWRAEFESRATEAERRSGAVNRDLLKSYEAYRDAYLIDINHFYSGLAALQMATIALALSTEPDWETLFDDADEAKNCVTKLDRMTKMLSPAVRLAIDAKLKQLADNDPDRIWAEISQADLRFIAGDPDASVRAAYRPSPSWQRFHRESITRQVQLFKDLGIRAELASAIILQLTPPPLVSPEKTPLHAVLFVGHMIDAANRPERRFPADREPEARRLIKERLMEIAQQGGDLRVFASAAHGADIICHELCAEQSIESIVCLPMPADTYSKLVFDGFENWRGRFLALADKQRTILELSNQEGLPNWLHGSPKNPWERGNSWVLKMVETSGAQRISLLALWDKKPFGDERGGTAHLIQEARNSGRAEEFIIDSNQLLA